MMIIIFKCLFLLSIVKTSYAVNAYATGHDDVYQLGVFDENYLNQLYWTPLNTYYVGNVERFTYITAGASHGAGVTDAGYAYTWGQNTHGQMCFNVNFNSYIGRPSLINSLPNGDTPKSVHSGHYSNFVIVLAVSGKVYGCGDYAVLPPATSNKKTPYTISGLPTIVDISCGEAFCVGISNIGELWSWGSNTFGQLGRTGTNVPAKITGLTNPTQVACGSKYCIATDSTSTTLYGWGQNEFGQLAMDPVTTSVSTPTALTLPASLQGKFIEYIGTASYTSYIIIEGKLYAFGRSQFGEKGIGISGSSYTASHTVDQVQGLLSGKTVVYVAAGDSHALAVTDDNKVYAWGVDTLPDYWGALGSGNSASSIPIEVDMSVLPSGEKALMLWGGNENSFIITTPNAPTLNSNGALTLGQATTSIAFTGSFGTSVSADVKLIIYQNAAGPFYKCTSISLASASSGTCNVDSATMMALSDGAVYAKLRRAKIVTSAQAIIGTFVGPPVPIAPVEPVPQAPTPPPTDPPAPTPVAPPPKSDPIIINPPTTVESYAAKPSGQGYTITIEGSGFIPASFQVKLVPGEFTCSINQAQSSTTKIVCTFNAGRAAGSYNVTVGAGFETVTSDEFLRITPVVSISANSTTIIPAQLIIPGFGFSIAGIDNVVTLYYDDNSKRAIVSVDCPLTGITTFTQMKCDVPLQTIPASSNVSMVVTVRGILGTETYIGMTPLPPVPPVTPPTAPTPVDVPAPVAPTPTQVPTPATVPVEPTPQTEPVVEQPVPSTAATPQSSVTESIQPGSLAVAIVFPVLLVLAVIGVALYCFIVRGRKQKANIAKQDRNQAAAAPTTPRGTTKEPTTPRGGGGGNSPTSPRGNKKKGTTAAGGASSNKQDNKKPKAKKPQTSPESPPVSPREHEMREYGTLIIPDGVNVDDLVKKGNNVGVLEDSDDLKKPAPFNLDKIKEVLGADVEVNLSREISFDELILEKELGSGAFGTVWRGSWQKTRVAIKVCSTQKKQQIAEFIREINLMIGIPPHPNVLGVLATCITHSTPAVCIELCPRGALDSLLRSSGVFEEKIQFKVVRGIANGMYHLHKNNIIHRDIAARNILMMRDYTPKVADFGMGRKIKIGDEVGVTGTSLFPIRWSAPEVLKTKQYSRATDVWAFGCLVTEILTGDVPFPDADLLGLGVEIRDHGKYPEYPEPTSPIIKELLQKIFVQNPSERPSFEEIIDFLHQKLPEEEESETE